MSFIWKPWEEFSKNLDVLPIDGPPCSKCVYWKPVQIFTNMGFSDGVQLCHAVEQHKDFSCYEPKNESE